MAEPTVSQDDLRAVIEARRELGPDLEPGLIDGFVERIEQRLAKRSELGELALKRKRDHQKEMVLGAMALSVPLFAIAAFAVGMTGVIVVCAMLVVIALVTAR